MSSNPFVVVACPIRNREWAVPLFFEGMSRQERYADEYLFVTGDNEDCTELDLCAVGYECNLKPVVEVFDTGCPGWRRSGEPRYSINDHAALADVYNRCIDQALERWPEATHVWMIDSDIAPDPGVLRLLLEADKDVISAVVRNSPGALNFMLGVKQPGNEPFRCEVEEGALEARPRRPFQVSFLSACTLFRREVLENWHNLGPGRDDFKVRYAPDPRSHDFPLCASARAAGYTLWVHPLARTSHYFHGPGKEPLR